jgi:transposase
MIDFPITEFLSDAECVKWLETFLHPEGFVCPYCESAERRLFREQGYFPAYRCLACDGYYTLLSNTVFEKTRQRPLTLVLLLRGIAKGEPSARLSRELGIGRKRVMELRQQIQTNLYDTLPGELMTGTAFEADELYQNAGKKSTRHPDVADPPRRRANKRKGKGTYTNDRPPIVSLISRTTHEVRYWVLEHADKSTTRTIIEGNVPSESTILYTDEASNYPGVHPHHASVCHSVKEWARDDDGDGVREVHCNSCEGAGTGLRTYLRTFRGVHKYYLADYVATYETMANAKQMTSAVIRRMCFGDCLHTKTSCAKYHPT